MGCLLIAGQGAATKSTEVVFKHAARVGAELEEITDLVLLPTVGASGKVEIPQRIIMGDVMIRRQPSIIMDTNFDGIFGRLLDTGGLIAQRQLIAIIGDEVYGRLNTSIALCSLYTGIAMRSLYTAIYTVTGGVTVQRLLGWILGWLGGGLVCTMISLSSV